MSNYKSVKEVLLELGYRPTRINNNYRMPALYRSGDHPTALSVNVNTGDFYDWVAGKGGSLEMLAKLTLGQEDVGKYLDGFSAEETLSKIEHVSVFDKKCLDALLPNYDYWKNRGISENTLKLFRNGVAHSNKLYQRSCFPIINPDGRIVGFSGRDIISKSNIKWKHLGYKKNFIYPAYWNEAVLLEKRQVILVESIGDVLTLWENGIKNTLCLFGLYISSPVLGYLIKINPNDILISTNNEISGRGNDAAIKIQEKLVALFDQKNIRIALPPRKDFGECSPEEILDFSKNFSII